MVGSAPAPVPVIPVADHELARRVIRWLAVGGVVLGTAQALAWTVQLLAWGMPATPPPHRVALRAISRTALAVSVIAPCGLVAGSLGLLGRRRWAQSVLTVYAYLQIAGAFASLVVGLTFMVTTSFGQGMSLAQKLAWPIMRAEDMVLHCAYPVAILLCLVRPGLMPAASSAAGTFEVLPAEADPARPARS